MADHMTQERERPITGGELLFLDLAGRLVRRIMDADVECDPYGDVELRLATIIAERDRLRLAPTTPPNAVSPPQESREPDTCAESRAGRGVCLGPFCVVCGACLSCDDARSRRCVTYDGRHDVVRRAAPAPQESERERASHRPWWDAMIGDLDKLADIWQGYAAFDQTHDGVWEKCAEQIRAVLRQHRPLPPAAPVSPPAAREEEPSDRPWEDAAWMASHFPTGAWAMEQGIPGQVAFRTPGMVLSAWYAQSQEVQRLRDLLRELEWTVDEDGDDVCPICEAVKVNNVDPSRRHFDGCRLARALSTEQQKGGSD